jgi:molecular chaperone DnaK (HSP70)
MTRISGDLERLAEEAEQQAQQEAERYAEGLRGRIDELNGSIEQGLEEQQGNLSETQRQRLDNIIADLQRQKESLREPTMEAIAESSRAIGEAQRQLGKIGNQSLAPYQEQWEEWSRQFEAELQRLLNDLSARREA